jgi:hypothetical protein
MELASLLLPLLLSGSILLLALLLPLMGAPPLEGLHPLQVLLLGVDLLLLVVHPLVVDLPLPLLVHPLVLLVDPVYLASLLEEVAVVVAVVASFA